MNNSLVSFSITSYNNYKYIFEAVDSVLEQDYPRIQLIISNDGAQDFKEQELRDYIVAHQGSNIEEVIIKNHETNQGTVRNMEYCRSQSKGEYLMYMAADDGLNGPNVLSRYVEEFERLGKDAVVLCSKVAMCGEKLDDVQSYEPNEEGIATICNSTPLELFGRLSHTWTIPTTSCMYRREVYELVGTYDTDYFIMEDGPLFVKLARKGIKIHWLNDCTAALHRGGGISHGNTLNLSESYRKYRYDEIIFFEKEILPFQDLLNDADKKLMQAKWDYLSKAYFETFVLPNMHGVEKLKYILSHFPQYLKGMLHRTKEKAVGWIEDNYLNRNLIVICLWCLSAYALFGYRLIPLPLSRAATVTVLQVLLGLALITGLFAIALRVMRIVRQLWLTVKYIFSGR